MQQGDQTVLNLRPGGGRGSRLLGPSSSSSRAGAPPFSFAVKSGDSRFEGRECVRHKEDGLLENGKGINLDDSSTERRKKEKEKEIETKRGEMKKLENTMFGSLYSPAELGKEEHKNRQYEHDTSSSSAVFRKIQFHRARKPFNGFSTGGSEFKIETLNPSSDSMRPSPGASLSGKRSDWSDLLESELDPELRFGMTFRRIGAGLANLGNTCFLNSVLQCLTYTEPLAAYLQSGKHQKSCHIAGFCALCAIQEHVKSALQKTGGILVPNRLVSNLRCISRNFRSSRQEDAHEYMINLLESMHKCCLPSGMPSESPKAYEKSLVHKIFGGSLRSQVKCKRCNHCSDKFDPFLDLSLEIDEAQSVQKALSHFTAVEQLDGGAEVYQCERCRRKVRAEKQLTVHKAPYVLTIHLKRFKAHDSRKIDKKVQFGPTIDMKPFVSGSSGGDLKYTLYSVLVHYGGTVHSGHYACFVRTSSGMWYSLDDNRVCQVGERTVLDQKAYMLFYVRDRKNVVPLNKTSPSVLSTPKVQVNGSTEVKLFGLGSPAAMAQKEASNVQVPKETLLKEVSCLETNGQKMAKISVEKDYATLKHAIDTPILNGNANIQSLENTSTSGVRTDNGIGKEDSTNKLEVSSVALARHSSKSVDILEPRNNGSCDRSRDETVSSTNSPNKEAVNNGGNLARKSADLATSSDMPSESQKLPTLDTATPIRPMKFRKGRVKNMHIGLKFFKLSFGLRKKKKHKRSKKRALEVNNLTLELLSQRDVAGLGPSTSESTRRVSSCSQGKVKNPKSRTGCVLTAASVGEFRERIHQNGCVLASDQNSLGNSGTPEASHQEEKERHSSKDSQKGPSEKDMMNMLTRGLEETVVATWDFGRPSQIVESKSESISIGYVPDEWDEEYDRGKRKKIRTHNKHDFGEPNPFQLLASKKFQSQKKAKIERTSSANTSSFRI